MSRTRTTTRPHQWGFVGQRIDTGYNHYLPVAYVDYGSYYYGYSMYSSMTDVLTSKGSRREWNPVTHQKIYSPGFGNNSVIIHYNYPTPDCKLTVGCVAPITLRTPSGIPSADWTNLINELADQLNGRINEGSLLLVTIAEARKTIRMVKNPFSLLKPDWRKRAESYSARDLVKRGANIWLEHLYGWKACYRDICAVSKTAAALYSQPNLEELDGWFQRYSATQVETISPESAWSGYSDSAWATLCSYFPTTNYSALSAFRNKFSGGKVTYSVGCRSLMDLQLRYSNTRRFLNAFGLDAPSIVSTLWELVPMSFVIDWFIDTRGLWAAIPKQRLLQSDVRQLGTSESIEVSSDWQMTFGRTPFYQYGSGTPWKSVTPTGYSGSNYFVSSGKYKSYKRTTGLPDTSLITSGFLTRGLNLSQAISGISLILQRALT
jgi:hypothetical protein